MLNSAMKFQLLIKTTYWKINIFLALKHSKVVFIPLINVKMPTIEQDKFHAQLSWAWKKFYNLGAWHTVHTSSQTDNEHYGFKATSLGLYGIPFLFKSLTFPGGRRPVTDIA